MMENDRSQLSSLFSTSLPKVRLKYVNMCMKGCRLQLELNGIRSLRLRVLYSVELRESLFFASLVMYYK